jgi:hypothetical protein
LCSVCLLLPGNLCAELSADLVFHGLVSFAGGFIESLFFARFGSTVFSPRAARNSVSCVYFGAHPGSRSVFRPPQLGFAVDFVLLVLISDGASTRSIFPFCVSVARVVCPRPVGSGWFPLARPFTQSKIWSPRGQISLCSRSGFGAVFGFNLRIDFSAHHHSSVSASIAVPPKLISFLV